ncbi:hypothetical protein D2962_08305 [Biomaibacter acetigenes]|uniref:Nucleoside 2-deoxyribosyltransferase n=1 Tax=Biomaibacter acetigenes TaxID=2316383 RepID=A0A3G2R5K3_9FIRM|nr:nucleoside 2-deoxyribosyltransferase [Biomaibacter acetigenes]AYO30625.1 hypothetical protein D2962_08305 [Biomaibacter acetigenes]
MAKTVYLSGSINGQSWHFAKEWRELASAELLQASYNVIDPTEGRKETDTDSKDIVERDLKGIEQADMLLVEMDCSGTAYIGTAMEIRYAWELGKEIIVWGKANRDSHWMRYHTRLWFDTLRDALLYLKEMNRYAAK